MGVLNRIQAKMDGFSKGQKRIARCLLEQSDRCARMTARELGELAQVSESTVVRFAVELGYGGYPALQKALREQNRSRLTSTERFQAARFSELPGAAIHADVELLRQMAATADRAAFQDVVERVLNARHIYILGVRSSSFVAGYLHFYLHLLMENVTLVQSNAAGEIFEQLFRIGPADVLIAISFPRYSQAAVSAVQFARDRGASIIAVTDNEQSPVRRCADAALLAPCGMISFVDSMAAPLSLMNALLVALANRLGTDACDVFAKLEEIWNEYGVFGKMDEDGWENGS